MGFVRCFDTLEPLIKNVTKSGMIENLEERNKLKEICNEIDKFMFRFDCYGFKVDVDKHLMDIIISVVFEDFQIDDFSDEFYNIVSATKEISLTFIDFEHLEISFVFNGIWNI